MQQWFNLKISMIPLNPFPLKLKYVRVCVRCRPVSVVKESINVKPVSLHAVTDCTVINKIPKGTICQF